MDWGALDETKTTFPGTFCKWMFMGSENYNSQGFRCPKPMPRPFDEAIPTRDAERIAKAKAKRERKAEKRGSNEQS